MISSLTSSVRRIEPFFGPDDQWVKTLRQTAWQAAQRVYGHKHTFVRDKGRADYVTTVDAQPQRVVRALYAAGYQRNLLSTVKTRNGETAHSSWVLDTEDTEWQQDVFIWENDNGTTDVYSHKEPSVRNPTEHLDLSTGIHGDPDGRVRAVLEGAGLDHKQRL
jgi:hypothetical protein